jgi:hypothetical protein
VVNDAYIQAKRAKGIIRPIRISTHGWTLAEIEAYKEIPPTGEDGIKIPYGARSIEALPYGVCPLCRYEIPKNYCLTYVKENEEEHDMCIPCAPGYGKTWIPIFGEGDP